MSNKHNNYKNIQQNTITMYNTQQYTVKCQMLYTFVTSHGAGNTYLQGKMSPIISYVLIFSIFTTISMKCQPIQRTKNPFAGQLMK